MGDALRRRDWPAAAGQRQRLGSLSFAAPACTNCWRETEAHPEGYLCESCGAWWYLDGSFDEWVDEPS